jgi:hypothetical protein
MRSLAEDLNLKRKTFLEKLKTTEDAQYIQLLDTLEWSDRKLTHELSSPGHSMSSNKTVLSIKHKEILTQLQNKQQFKETITTLFECFIKGVNYIFQDEKKFENK